MEQNDLAVDIFNEDPEALGSAVDLLIPPEVRNDGEINTEEGASNRLHLGRQPSDHMVNHI